MNRIKKLGNGQNPNRNDLLAVAAQAGIEQTEARQILEEIQTKVAERLQWVGYTYRYWHYYTGESNNEIYAIANAERMVTVYPGFHSLDVKMAIDRLKGK